MQTTGYVNLLSDAWFEQLPMRWIPVDDYSNDERMSDLTG